MKRFIQTLQEKTGFISIETIIVSGLFMALGVYAFSRFYTETDVVIDKTMEVASIPTNVKVPTPPTP